MDIKTILLAMVLMLFSFGGAASAGGELNLNHASAAELQTLKGIGHKKLEALKGHLEVGDSKQDD